MSNLYDKRQGVYVERADFSRGKKLTSDINRAITEIKVDSSIWDVNWMGMTFSIRPFLSSALSFVDCVDVLSLSFAYIKSENKNFYQELNKMCFKDFYSMFTDDENDLYQALLYQFDSQVPCVIRYMTGSNNVSYIKHIIGILIKEFICIFDVKDNYIVFHDEDLCNTQAFSYYISMYWALQKSKKLQLYLNKEIRAVNFNDLLLKLCPENSLHYKYLSGEITSKELAVTYLEFNDKGKSPIVFKELFNLLDKKHKYSEDYKDFMKSFISGLVISFRFDEFVRIACCSYITTGVYSKDQELIDDLLRDKELIDKECSNLRDEARNIRNTLKVVTKENSSLKDTVNLLNAKLELSSDSRSKIVSLRNEINSLKSEISRLNKSLEVKDKEISESKKVIRSHIKEIKSLNARVNELKEYEPIFLNDDYNKEVEIPLDTIVERLKSKKIGVFGGFDAGDLVRKFENYGISIKHIVNDVRFSTGDLDCVVVLTTNVQHRLVYQLKSQYNGVFIYFNGTSVEGILREVYNRLEVC